jgi:hypothetical protein
MHIPEKSFFILLQVQKQQNNKSSRKKKNIDYFYLLFTYSNTTLRIKITYFITRLRRKQS